MALTKEESDKLAKLEKLILFVDAEYAKLFTVSAVVTTENVANVLLSLYYEDCKKVKDELKAKV